MTLFFGNAFILTGHLHKYSNSRKITGEVIEKLPEEIILFIKSGKEILGVKKTIQG